VSRIVKKADEPIQGLPEPLPPGEEILWQGAPSLKPLLRTAFHAHALLAYFGVLLALRGASVWEQTQSALATSLAVIWLAPLFLLALAMVFAMAWLTARTTVYTITTRRVVMRIGVVLDLTLNLPFEALDAIDLKAAKDGSGDISLRLPSRNKIAYLHLWPHARPWRLRQPEPMFRAVADVAAVGQTLAAAVGAVSATQQHAPKDERKAATSFEPGHAFSTFHEAAL